VGHFPEEEFRHMKQSFVSSLQDGQTVTSHFLVCEKEIRATREGKSYLRLELGDATGRVEARMWEGFDRTAATFERDDFVKVQARVENYRNKLQLAIEKIRRAEESEVDPADFFPHTKEDVDRCTRSCSRSSRRWQSLAPATPRSVVQDPEIVPRLKRAPAAKVMHHAFTAACSNTSSACATLCRVVLGSLSRSRSRSFAHGAVLHDIGKLAGTQLRAFLGYTDEGQLLGHI
jgi:3'-5' exoribonuclease